MGCARGGAEVELTAQWCVLAELLLAFCSWASGIYSACDPQADGCLDFYFFFFSPGVGDDPPLCSHAFIFMVLLSAVLTVVKGQTVPSKQRV